MDEAQSRRGWRRAGRGRHGDPQPRAAAATCQINQDLPRPDPHLSGDPTEIGQRHKAKRISLFGIVRPVADVPDVSERRTAWDSREQDVEALRGSHLGCAKIGVSIGP